MPDGVEYADSGGTAPGAAAPDGDRQAAADGPDTEQLRLLIQRYRRLFDRKYSEVLWQGRWCLLLQS
jgi:hypothetical protein